MKLVIELDIHQTDESLRNGEAVYAPALVKAAIESLPAFVGAAEPNYVARVASQVTLIRARVAVVAEPIYEDSEKLYGRPAVATRA